MNRRAYLVGTTGLIGCLAGCSGVLGDGSNDDTEDPTVVAEAFLAALFAGDLEKANTYVHEEADIHGRLQSYDGFFVEQDFRLDGTTVTRRENGQAKIDADVTFAPASMDSRADSQLVLGVLRTGGNWRVTVLSTPGF